jgi:hypothetical protein
MEEMLEEVDSLMWENRDRKFDFIQVMLLEVHKKYSPFYKSDRPTQ